MADPEPVPVPDLAVTGWALIGTTRRNGHVVGPEGVRFDFSDGHSRWYPGSLAAALDRCQLETGADTRPIRARIDRWVATGDPNG